MNHEPTTDESTQPFDINDDTAEPSHRPEHDAQRDRLDDEMNDDESSITPEDTASE